MRLPKRHYFAFMLLTAGVASCTVSSTGPSCAPFVDYAFVSFPVFAPAGGPPFANANLRQEFVSYPPGCGVPNGTFTFLSFNPIGFPRVHFTYTLAYRGLAYNWNFPGVATLDGSGRPTPDVLVSTAPEDIRVGVFNLFFQSFVPY